ncbi:MAG: hypothetical protein IT310_11855 [Anaerolineales bacterium]|nr:hypothetical protein [Anaerolineales bacterium]
MTTYRRGVGDGIKTLWHNLIQNRQFNRGAAWGMMIIGALLAFEVFNFSTTQYALHDMLGDLTFAGFRWASILAVAFCGIDFAGIARIFTPEQGRDEPAEVYYLFGAWVLAAGFNAALTWWGVSVAIQTNGSIHATSAMSAETLTKFVPIFVASMVWLVRVLIIGTFSLAGDRLFTTAGAHAPMRPYNAQPKPYPQPQPRANNSYPQPRPSYPVSQNRTPVNQPTNQPILRPASQIARPVNSVNNMPTTNNTFRPAPKPTINSQQTSFMPPEPTYHPVSYGARNPESGDRHYDA